MQCLWRRIQKLLHASEKILHLQNWQKDVYKRQWLSILSLDTTTLVFLAGLTADHRLFDKQVAYFDEKYNIIVWDAPAHASSWPFRFDFDLFDKAKWLNGFPLIQHRSRETM